MPCFKPARTAGLSALSLALALAASLAQAQSVPPRWHGTWTAADGSAIAVTAQGFQVDGQACAWSATAPKAPKGCAVHPDQPAEKPQLVRLIDDAEVALKKKASPQAKAALARSRQNLAGLPERSFDAVAIVSSKANGCATYAFIDKTTLYRVLDCSAAPEAAQVLAYKKGA